MLRDDGEITARRAERDRKVRRIVQIEGIANIAMAALKAGLGLWTGSLAILGDALHSVTDAGNNVVAWAVVGWAARPADENHPYGHRKFETVAVFLLAMVLTWTAIELGRGAIARERTVVDQSAWGAVGMLLVLLVNLGLGTWESYWARRLESNLLRADARHTLSDGLTTLVAFVGWQAAVMGYLWIDALAALGVSALILFLAFGLFRRALPVLVDQASVDATRLRERVLGVPHVVDAMGIRSRSDGVDTTVELSVVVPSSLPTSDSHEVAHRVEELVRSEFGASSVMVHVEPSETS